MSRRTEHELHSLARKLRYDLTAAQGKLSELLRGLAELERDDHPEFRCPECRIDCRGLNQLEIHVYTSHDGPLPSAWARLDALVAPEPPEEESDAEQE